MARKLTSRSANWRGISVADSVAAAEPEAEIYNVLHNHRYKELDGLRGIAALAVCIDHGLDVAIIVPAAAFGSSFIASTALLINGAVAVDLFFIMSGFFLSGMLVSLRLKSIMQFYVRRLVRLAPPAVISVVLLYLFAFAALRSPPSSANITDLYVDFCNFNRAIPAKILLLNLALIRHTLNPPLWTIRLEIFTSIIFPAVIFLKNLLAAAAYRFALIVMFIFIAVALNNHQKLGIDVFHYLYIFYAGALIREYGQHARELSRQMQYALFVFAVIGLGLTGEYDPLYGAHPILFDLPVTVFGSILIVLLGFGGIASIRGFMNSRPMQFLGRISYSFYLMNWLAVMSTAMFIMHTGLLDHYGAAASVGLLVAASTILCLLLAYGLHITVEQPATALSRFLGARYKAQKP